MTAHALLAHAGRPLEPHDLWTAWNADPLLVGGLVAAAWAYRRGAARRRRTANGQAWRDRCFTGALVAVGAALLSPLDALSGALASAHMAQHLLLVLVAAPLLALSAPTTTLLRGSPATVRNASVRWRRLPSVRAGARLMRHPAPAFLLPVGALWFWHAAVPYDAAVGNHLVHVVEHATFLVTGVLFWRVIVGAREAERVPPGLGILLVFAMGMQSVFLSALLTFARGPWYSAYAGTTAAWGLDPLADQQLAGVIMWIPAGVVYVGAGLSLLVTWLRATESLEQPA